MHGLQNALDHVYRKSSANTNQQRPKKVKIFHTDLADEEDTEAKEVIDQKSPRASPTAQHHRFSGRNFVRAVTDLRKARNSVSSQDDNSVHNHSGRSSAATGSRGDDSSRTGGGDMPLSLHGGALTLRQRSFQMNTGRTSKQSNYRTDDKSIRAHFLERLLSEREQDSRHTIEVPTFAEPTKGILKNSKIRQLYSDIEEPVKTDPRRLFPAIAHTNVHAGNPHSQHTHHEDIPFDEYLESAKKNSKSVRFRENTDTYHLPEAPAQEENPPQETVKKLPVGKVEIEGYFIGKFA